MSEGPLISLSFRADFEQPIGVLNRGGFKVAGAIPIEIYKSSRGWQARRVANPPVPLEQVTPQPSAETARSQMCLYFKTRLTAWTAYEQQGPVSVPVEPEAYYTDPAGRFRRKNSK